MLVDMLSDKKLAFAAIMNNDRYIMYVQHTLYIILTNVLTPYYMYLDYNWYVQSISNRVMMIS